MDIVLLLMIVLLVAIALALILYPLWQQTKAGTAFQISSSGHQILEEYQAQYRAALAAIKDLTFDYEMGKISTEDYETVLAKSKLTAAKIRQQVDLLDHLPQDQPVDDTVAVEIEQLVAGLRNNAHSTDKLLLAEVEAEIELLKNAPPSHSTLTCQKCGQSVQPGDVFCSRCGQPVAQPQADPSPDPNKCPECGYKIKAGDAFCAKCGAALKEMPLQNYENANP